jgi:hypothetical protein
MFMCLTIICFASSAEAWVESSPAGGGYIEFNSDDDFLSTVKPWLPDERPQTLTVEGWIYLESIPELDTRWSIIGQEDRFEIAVINTGNFGSSFGMVVYADNNIKGTSCLSAIPGLPLGKWTHFIVWYAPNVSYGFKGLGSPDIKPNPKGFILNSSSPLRIGGIIPPKEGKCGLGGRNTFFRGYIDEVRISSSIRCEKCQAGLYLVPKKEFVPDENTICLWHFDEDSEINGYQDSSGNGWTLWKNESFDVKSSSGLYTLWGKLKYE